MHMTSYWSDANNNRQATGFHLQSPGKRRTVTSHNMYTGVVVALARLTHHQQTNSNSNLRVRLFLSLALPNRPRYLFSYQLITTHSSHRPANNTSCTQSRFETPRPLLCTQEAAKTRWMSGSIINMCGRPDYEVLYLKGKFALVNSIYLYFSSYTCKYFLFFIHQCKILPTNGLPG